MSTSEARFCRFIVCAAFLINVSAMRISADLQSSRSSVSKPTYIASMAQRLKLYNDYLDDVKKSADFVNSKIATDIASQNQAIVEDFVSNSTDSTYGDVEVVFRCPYLYCSECCASAKVTNGFECILREAQGPGNEVMYSWPNNRGCTMPEKRKTILGVNTTEMTVHCSNRMTQQPDGSTENAKHTVEVSRPETMPQEQCVRETPLERENRLLHKYHAQKRGEGMDAQTRKAGQIRAARTRAANHMDFMEYFGIVAWMIDQESLVTQAVQKVPLGKTLLVHPIEFIGAIEKTVVRAREVRKKILLFEKESGEPALDAVTRKNFDGMFSTSDFLFANLGTNFGEDGNLLPLEQVPDKVMIGERCTNCRYLIFEGNGRISALRWGLAGDHLFNDLQIEGKVWSFLSSVHERMAAELAHTTRLLGGVEKFSTLRVPQEVLDAPADDEALKKVQTWGRSISDVLNTHITEERNWAKLLQLTGGLQRQAWFRCFSGFSENSWVEGCLWEVAKIASVETWKVGRLLLGEAAAATGLW